MNFRTVSLILTVLRNPGVVLTGTKNDKIPANYLSLRMPNEYEDGTSSENSLTLDDTHNNSLPYMYRRAEPLTLVVDDQKIALLAAAESRIPEDCVQPWEGIDNLTVQQARTICEGIWSTYQFPREGKDIPSCYPKLQRNKYPNTYGGYVLIGTFQYINRPTMAYHADFVKCFCNYTKPSLKPNKFRGVKGTQKYFFLMKFSDNDYAVLTAHPKHNSTHFLVIVDYKWKKI